MWFDEREIAFRPEGETCEICKEAVEEGVDKKYCDDCGRTVCEACWSREYGSCFWCAETWTKEEIGFRR